MIQIIRTHLKPITYSRFTLWPSFDEATKLYYAVIDRGIQTVHTTAQRTHRGVAIREARAWCNQQNKQGEQ